MIKTIDVYDMKDEFIKANRDYYSISGLKELLDFFNEIDENMELDCIDICCDCTEYGEGATCSFSDLIDDYGYLYPVEEYKELNDNYFDEMDYIIELIAELGKCTTVLQASNGNYIVFAF